MLFRKSPEKFWDLIASRYAASPIDDLPGYEAKIAKLKTYLKPEYEVLDIGCGTGTQCMDLAGDVKHVVGADFSAKLLAIAEQRKSERKIENVEFVKASMADMNFAPEQFDVVMAFYVLHFCQDIDDLFDRIHKWLKPGGLLVTESYCLGEHSVFQVMWIRFFGKLGFMPLINRLTYKQLEQAMANAGFTLIEKTQYRKKVNEYTLVAKKAT